MSNVHDAAALHRVDMNLFVAFDALARERSVTKAAARAGVTQSAMSHTLRRLRELFGDPLFVRARGGLLLTPRAEALVVPLRTGLFELSRALGETEVFDPATARRELRVLSPDLFDVLVLPALLPRLAREAPGIDLSLVAAPRDLAQSLATGALDLAVSPVLLGRDAVDLGAPSTPDLCRRTLFRDDFRCFVRTGHPAITESGRLPMRSFTSLSHVLVSPTGEGPGLVDRLLAERSKARRVALRVPHFASAMVSVRASDLVLTAPASLARAPGASPGLVMLAPPLKLPQHAITLVWHPRFSEDPGHRWLRELLDQVTEGIASRPGRARA